MSSLFRHPLDSRVGRRIAAVAVLSALAPLAVFGSVIFARARTQFETQARQRLHQDAKTAALNGLARLRMMEEELRWLVPVAAASPGRDANDAITGLLDEAEALSVLPADGTRVALKGAGTPPALTAAESRHLRDSGAVLLSSSDADWNWLVVGHASGAQAAARLSTAAIFGLAEATSLPDEEALCLRTAVGHVACSSADAATAAAVRTAALPQHGEATMTIGEVTYVVRTWALPLQGDYHAGVWTAVALVPQTGFNATLGQLERDVALLTAASLVVVILAVLASVRRNLRPLTALEAAAARLSRGEFDVHLDVSSGDEFETLATGFNGMVTAIRAHVEDIRAFSEGSATALARTIDAKSPWTAGHSERVTAVALEIGRTLGLPAADLMVLQRGGLLHDIGKLATPIEILDKAGPLTPEERAQVQQHPRDGVRILEPITHFAPLVPIVLEHHERFDGLGYPDGKAGEAIHPLARVLAVADVYDALVSDRPYRPGLAHAAALDVIRAGVGTQFEPRVVDAFLQVVARGAVPSPPLLSHGAGRRSLAAIA